VTLPMPRQSWCRGLQCLKGNPPVKYVWRDAIRPPHVDGRASDDRAALRILNRAPRAGAERDLARELAPQARAALWCVTPNLRRSPMRVGSGHRRPSSPCFLPHQHEGRWPHWVCSFPVREGWHAPDERTLSLHEGRAAPGVA
jgi:hypothetical protein